MNAGGQTMRTITLDGGSLAVHDLALVARNPAARVECAPAALERVAACRGLIETIVSAYKAKFDAKSSDIVQDYGVTTGFGEFKSIPIRPHDMEALQRNVVLSHASGVGETSSAGDPANYYAPEIVRAALTLRINAFLRGNSGVRVGLVKTLVEMLNRGIVPLVPLKGSVGSSGDLCPLAHLFCVLLGEGEFHVLSDGDSCDRLPLRAPTPARDLPKALAPFELCSPEISYKEGLALTNGATFSVAMLALAVHDAEGLAAAADVALALTLEAARGCVRAFDPKVQSARGLRGQTDAAAHILALLARSRLADGAADKVQDAYSVRCAAAVHGASRDAIAFARMIAEREINAATDNPLFFPGVDGGYHADPPCDFEFRANWPKDYHGESKASYSAANFHGQPVALAADVLAIALAELADISERRTQMLLDENHNRGLPANLVARPGVHSGFMLAQYAAAALVSENKVLCHPAVVDSIPTSSNSEDHVSMANLAGRKLRTVLGNTTATLAIETLVGCHGVEWRAVRIRQQRDAEKAGPRANVETKKDVASATSFARAEAIAERAERDAAAYAQCLTDERDRQAVSRLLGAGTSAAYRTIRRSVAPTTVDHVLEGDIRAVRRLIESGELPGAARSALPDARRRFASVARLTWVD